MKTNPTRDGIRRLSLKQRDFAAKVPAATPDVKPLDIAADVTPLDITPELAPLKITKEITPLEITPDVTPPNITPDLTPLDMRPARLGMRPTQLGNKPSHLGLREPMTQERRDRVRLRLASWAFTTRRVALGAACAILPPEGRPLAGDLVLARVDAVGHHTSLQLVNGRRRQLFSGNEVVVAYGNRYASNQFESEVPESLGPCHLVAGGGIASRVRSWHMRISRGPTEITPIGLLADSRGKRLNLLDFALEAVEPPRDYWPPSIAVVGTSMDSGKTQTCVHLVRGLLAGGTRVGYAKLTGTGAGGDFWSLHDAGADPVLDFTDVGMSTTYLLSPEAVRSTMVSLMSHLAHHGVDAMILEIADGILQRETEALLCDAAFHQRVGGIVLAAQDSMGAMAGVNWLRERPTPVLALSGILTAAPLQVREARQATGLAIYDREGLATGSVAMELLDQAQRSLDARFSGITGAA